MKKIILIAIASISLISCNEGADNKTYNVRVIGGGKLTQEANGSKVGDTVYCGWSNLKDKPLYGVIQSENN